MRASDRSVLLPSGIRSPNCLRQHSRSLSGPRGTPPHSHSGLARWRRGNPPPASPSAARGRRVATQRPCRRNSQEIATPHAPLDLAPGRDCGSSEPFPKGCAKDRLPPTLPFRFVVANGRFGVRDPTCRRWGARWINRCRYSETVLPGRLWTRSICAPRHHPPPPKGPWQPFSGSRCKKSARWSRRCRRRRAASRPSRPQARRAGPRPRHDARQKPRSPLQNSHSSLPAGHP
jgi:hypothetical protein